MSRSIKSWMTVSMTSIAVTTGSLLLVIPAAHATPEPYGIEKHDRCDGTVDDGYDIPDSPDKRFGLHGTGLNPGPHSTEGEVNVLIEVYSYPTWEYITTVPLDYPNNDTCPTPAPNTTWMQKGTCDEVAGKWGFNGGITNATDPAPNDKPLRSVQVKAVSYDGRYTSVAYSEPVQVPIYDGNSASVVFTPFRGVPQGNWQFEFDWTGDGVADSVIYATAPRCGEEALPNDDTPQAAKPKGSIKQLGDRPLVQIKATASRSAKSVTPFRLVTMPLGHKRTITPFAKLKPGKSKVKIIEGEQNTRYKLQAKIKVRQPNGDLKVVWMKVASGGIAGPPGS